MCKYTQTVFYFFPSSKRMQKLCIFKINGNSAVKWAVLTCIFHFSGYPLSARLICGYDSALEFQVNSIWNSSRVTLKKLAIPQYTMVFLIVLGWILYFGLDPSLLWASPVLWKQKKTLLLQHWGIQKQVNRGSWNNMSGRNSSGPLWNAHTTLMTNEKKSRAWTDGQSHFYTQRWTWTTGK